MDAGLVLTATLATPITVGGVKIEAQLAPLAGEGIEDRIIAAMNGARRLRMAAFLISDPRFAAVPSHPYTPGKGEHFMHNKVLVIDGHTS